MFKQLLSKIKQITTTDPISFSDRLKAFNDPMAEEIGWEPISRIHIGYFNRRPFKTRHESLFFIPSMTAVFFPMMFILMGGYLMWASSLLQPGLEAMIFYPVHTFRHYLHLMPRLLASDRIWVHLFGLVFLLMGLVHLFYSVRPIVFNNTRKVYAKGFWPGHKISFDEIHAVQVISASGSGPDTSSVYEVNLVLKTRKRIHVYGHPGRERIVSDAAELSKMLSIPIWDTT